MIDFNVQKLYYDALDDMRIAYRWMARDKENEEIKEAKCKGKEYIPFRYVTRVSSCSLEQSSY